MRIRLRMRKEVPAMTQAQPTPWQESTTPSQWPPTTQQPYPQPPRKGLSPKQIIAIVAGTLLLVCCGVGAIGAAIGDPGDRGGAPASTRTPASRTAAGVDTAPTSQSAGEPAAAAPPTTPPPPVKTTAKPATTKPRTTTTRPRTTTSTPQCHPSYEGACVPYASDVDCAGGDGDGPVYIEGPVRVVGPDVYDLDRDNDGWGCED